MKTLSVVIGRFQVPFLHEGHLHLLREACRRAEKTLVMIGCTNKADGDNPMDYTVRRAMIKQEFPNVYAVQLFDFPNDDARWSKEIDSILLSHLDEYDITLYGSRDSFLKHYKGRIKKEYIEPVAAVSGTQLREAIKPIPSSDFRAGIIYAIQNYLKNYL